MKSTAKSPDVSAAACRERLEKQKRPVEDRLAGAGQSMKSAGNGIMAVVACLAFLLVVVLPLALAAFH